MQWPVPPRMKPRSWRGRPVARRARWRGGQARAPNAGRAGSAGTEEPGGSPDAAGLPEPEDLERPNAGPRRGTPGRSWPARRVRPRRLGKALGLGRQPDRRGFDGHGRAGPRLRSSAPSSFHRAGCASWRGSPSAGWARPCGPSPEKRPEAQPMLPPAATSPESISGPTTDAAVV